MMMNGDEQSGAGGCEGVQMTWIDHDVMDMKVNHNVSSGLS